MLEDKTPKKHRHSRGYTILVVSDDSDGSTGTVRLGHVSSQLLAFGLFFAIVLLICYIVYSVMTIDGLERVTVIQSDRISALIKENESLESKNAELSAKVDQLNKSISSKVVKEANAESESAQKHLPTGAPVMGASTMQNTRDPEEADTIEEALALLAEREQNGLSPDDVPGDPILYFSDIAEGSSVVAAGDGIVSAVTDDKKYGRRIEIDHGNGYVSIYRNAGDAMVREGDEVIQGSILFVVAGNNTLGYQIKQDDVFIDPEEITEIDG
ncbi:MAG: M23 family metallopeptidase [Lachnospiraceae bacterium]|nr:M23 family metallopeptidase [Lachnospiraceae bacterium]